MSKISNLNTPPQLRQGKAHVSDPIAHVKATQKGYANVSHRNEVTPTPSNSRPVDGHLGDDADDKGNGMWRDMDATTKANTYTTESGGSTCGDGQSD